LGGKVSDQLFVSTTKKHSFPIFPAAMNCNDPLVADYQLDTLWFIKAVARNVQLAVPISLAPTEAVKAKVSTCNFLSNRAGLRLNPTCMWSDDGDQGSFRRLNNPFIVDTFQLRLREC
jgi:hypothetical protein